MLLDAVLTLILGTWLALSIAGQIHVMRPRFLLQRPRAWDPFGLIPIWTFFAPRPAWTDYHLLYRDSLEDGTITPWTEVVVVVERRWWHWVWNPSKHARKAIIDMIRTFTREVDQTRARALRRNTALTPETWKVPANIFTSLPYLNLLHLVSNVPRFISAASTQFLIMRVNAAGNGDPVVMMVSAFHEL